MFDATGHNNGRVKSTIDGIVGETVNYTYDGLNRLTLAETSGSGGWGQSFTYDGFGNMTAKTATKGSGVPSFSTTINPATNGGPTSYAPGIPDTTDVENRLFGASGGATYTYDQANKRVLVRTNPLGGGSPHNGTWDFAFYGIGGKRLVTMSCVWHTHGNDPDTFDCANKYDVYFGGKMVKSKDVVVVTDRLGSVRANGNSETFAYYPYGEERGTTAENREKFGTYVRDWSGIPGDPPKDYADQRYYGVGTGRLRV
jgi:YD repeat-containing protein